MYLHVDVFYSKCISIPQAGDYSKVKPLHTRSEVTVLESVRNKFSAFHISYSGKLSRQKTFTNFVDLEPFVKVFLHKI